MNKPIFSYLNASFPENFTRDYRFGFNGKENDLQHLQDYGLRNYVTNLGRFFKVDPLSKSFPWYSTYQFAGNKPIIAIDLEGAEEFIRTQYFDINGNLYRTEIQVIGSLGSNSLSPNGLGPIQYVHETQVRMMNNGGQTSHIATYQGTTIGQLTLPSALNGLNAPGSTAFNLLENQSLSNQIPIGRDAQGNLITEFTSVFAEDQTILISNRLSNGATEIGSNGRPNYRTAGRNSSGILRLDVGLAPQNEGYLPLGFNVTPSSPANRWSNSGQQLNPQIQQTLSIDINLNIVALKAKTSEQIAGTIVAIPNRQQAESVPGPMIRSRQRTQSVTF